MSALVTLGVDEVLALHRRQIARWGGAEGLRDLPAIEAACNAPLEVHRYEGGDVVDCAAALMWHLCACLLYTSPSPRDRTRSRMPSSA